MSQENMEVVREVVAAWNSHDFERWLACWDAACEWVPRLRAEVEGEQTYRGQEGLGRYWKEDDSVWDRFLMDFRDVRAIGDQVIAIGTGIASGRESGVEVTRPLAMRFHVTERKIVRGESYLDVSEALEAVGLSE
jgi:ketosteroid isomerase-like protein